MRSYKSNVGVAFILGFGFLLHPPRESFAAFLVSGYLVPSVPAEGIWNYQLRIFNDGVGGTGTQINSINFDLFTGGSTAASRLLIDISRDLDGDEIFDANVTGTGLGFGSAAGTFIRIGNAAQFAPLSVRPEPNTFPSGVLDPIWSNLHVLHVEGFHTSGGVVANTGNGALFMNIVVPAGVGWLATGYVGSEVGASQAIFVVPALTPFPIEPEPGTTWLIAVAVGVALTKRRRNVLGALGSSLSPACE